MCGHRWNRNEVWRFVSRTKNQFRVVALDVAEWFRYFTKAMKCDRFG